MKSKKVAISQSNYIPWRGYFENIKAVDEFVLYDDMQYTKRDWRNRNKIKTQEGLKWLTIPVVVKGNYYQKINETKISDLNWRRKHLASLRNVYSKAKIIAVNQNQHPLESYPVIKKIKKRIKGLLFSRYIDVFIGASAFEVKELLLDLGKHIRTKTQVIYNGIEILEIKQELKIAIFGDGPYKLQLKALVKELKLETV